LDIRGRERAGIRPQNTRLQQALKKYPPATWRFEILEKLPPACAEETLRAAEQRHIDRLCTYRKSKGFNVFPAVYAGNGPAQKAGRRFKRKVLRKMKARQREYWRAWQARQQMEGRT